MSGATEFYKIGQQSKGNAKISPCGSFQHSGPLRTAFHFRSAVILLKAERSDRIL